WKVKIARQRSGCAHDWRGARRQSRVRFFHVWLTQAGRTMATVAKKLRRNPAHNPEPWQECPRGQRCAAAPHARDKLGSSLAVGLGIAAGSRQLVAPATAQRRAPKPEAAYFAPCYT